MLFSEDMAPTLFWIHPTIQNEGGNARSTKPLGRGNLVFDPKAS